MSLLFGDARQVGMVVHDAAKAMAQWARLGVGPFFTMTFTMDDYRYRGEPGEAPEVTLGFAHTGQLQIEVIQQHNTAPSAYMEFLNAGHEGVQHLCGWYADHASYDTARHAMQGQGLTIVHEGGLRVADARFCYFETELPGAMMLEISEAMCGEDGKAIDLMIEASRNWDGRQVVAAHRSL